jgi:hypothetical protein
VSDTGWIFSLKKHLSPRADLLPFLFNQIKTGNKLPVLIESKQSFDQTNSPLFDKRGLSTTRVGLGEDKTEFLLSVA